MLRSDLSEPGAAGPHRRFCHRCRHSGHWANQCPHRSTAKSPAAAGPHACYACGDPGHYARDCPRKHKPFSGGSGSGSGGGGSGAGSRPCPTPQGPEGSTQRVDGSSGGGRPSPAPGAAERSTRRAGTNRGGGGDTGARSYSISRNPEASTKHAKEKEKEEKRNDGSTKKVTPCGGGGPSRWVRREPGASSQTSHRSSNRANSSGREQPKTLSSAREQEKEVHCGTKDRFTSNEPIAENNSLSSRNKEKEKDNSGTKNRWVRKDSSSSSSSSGFSSNPPETPSSTHEKEKENRGGSSGAGRNRRDTKDGAGRNRRDTKDSSSGNGSADHHDSIDTGSVGYAMGIYENSSDGRGSSRNNGGMGRIETSGMIKTGFVSSSSSDTSEHELPVSLTDFEEGLMNFYGGGCGKEKSGHNKQGSADGRSRDGNCNSGESRNNNGMAGSWDPVVIEISSSSSSEDEDEQVVGKKSIGSFATTVRVKEERRKVVKEDDEDCVILDANPFEPPTDDFEHKLSLLDHKPSGEDEDLCVISERGQVACRDYPHSRQHCAKYPFGNTSHESYCPQCYCYVCDIVAPCEDWSGRGSSGHCHASDRDETWTIIRLIHREKQRVKSDSLQGSTMPIHPLHDTLPHQLWWD